jgi:general secretion pathway protein C
MGKFKRVPHSASASGMRERVFGVLRPSAEALLLAAVALGCAQAGWSVLTPSSAGAADTVSSDEHGDTMLDVASVQSPFAPHSVASGAESHAIAAMVSGIELNGVRLADEHARSGAMLMLGDGAERAFLIGEEIADGLTLADVDAQYVLLAYEGGQRRLEMTAAPSYSFARAMMGLEQAPGAPGNAGEQSQGSSFARAMLGLENAPQTAAPEMAESAPVAAQAPQAGAQFTAAPVAGAPTVSVQDRAWLASTLANVEITDGEARGWRIAAPPSAAQAAGLREGDLVVSVNGAGPTNVAQALAAARAQRLDLVVERGGARVRITIDIDQAT